MLHTNRKIVSTLSIILKLKLINPSPLNIKQHSKFSFTTFISSCTPTAPNLVLNLTVQPSELNNGWISLTVTWDEPHSDVDIIQYNGNYRILPSGSWTGNFTQPARKRQHVYRNVMSGVNYEVRVRAVSAIGAGEYRTATTSCMLLIRIQSVYYSCCSMTLQNIDFVGDTRHNMI